MEIVVGSVVYSKAGHDKRKIFLVLSVEQDYAYIADGSLRKLEKPKKKKLIHLQSTNFTVEVKDLSNSKIRQMLAQYKSG